MSSLNFEGALNVRLWMRFRPLRSFFGSRRQSGSGTQRQLEPPVEETQESTILAVARQIRSQPYKTPEMRRKGN